MNPLKSFEIDYNSGLPTWIQIKNRVAYLIGSGAFAEGEKLPTVRSLALDLDISYNTVNRAYMDLEREGYITTRKGRGCFVKGGSVADRNGYSSIEAMAEDMIRAARTAGIDDNGILSIVQEKLAST